MALGPKTAVVDGQRVSVPTYDAYAPIGFGQTVQMQPIRQVGIPPMIGAGINNASFPEGVNGYGTAGNNLMATSIAAQNPWNFRVSPLPWAIIGLLVSIFLLAAVHWRKTTLGGDETVHLGPAEEHAEAEA